MNDIDQEIDRLERRAELRESQAQDREDGAALRFGIGRPAYYGELDTAERYRREARELRDDADRLRRQRRA